MNIDEYKAKQERKQEAYERLANKNKVESEKTFNHADKMAQAIPFGQPILIGHYSEKSDRNFRAKIDRTFRKGLELKKTAEYYADKANRIENSHVIRSDDPEAIQKLKEKLTEIDKEIEQVKEHNKQCKNFICLRAFQFREGFIKISNTNGNYKDYAKIVDGVLIWVSKKIPENIKTIIENYHKTGKLEQPELPKDKIKYDSYVLQNLNGNKTRIKERIKELEAISTIQNESKVINGITLTIDKNDNRVKLFFPNIPSQEIRTQLKQNGFHWSPFNKAWQRMINNHAIYQAERIMELVKQ